MGDELSVDPAAVRALISSLTSVADDASWITPGVPLSTAGAALPGSRTGAAAEAGAPRLAEAVQRWSSDVRAAATQVQGNLTAYEEHEAAFQRALLALARDT